MILKTRHVVAASLALATLPLFSQGNAVQVTDPALPYMIQVDLRELTTEPNWKPGDPIVDIPRMGGMTPKPGSDISRPDPLLDQQVRGGTDPDFGNLFIDFSTAFTGSIVADTVGDVGRKYFIQATNAPGGSRYAVYDKTDGSLVAGPFTIETLASGAPCDSAVSDPIVTYDHLAGRWLLSELSASRTGLCVYVSMTSDPIAGGWYAYSFPVSGADYPKYGVWPDAYYATTWNDGGNPSRIFALDRQRMIAGLPATALAFDIPHLDGYAFDPATPVDLDGPPPKAGTPGFFVRQRDDELHNSGANDPDKDFLELWYFFADFEEPADSALVGPLSIEMADFDSELCPHPVNCVPQPGVVPSLDSLREVVMHRASYRNHGTHESLIGNFVTEADGMGNGGIRWFELRRTGGALWSLHQEGTHFPDSHTRWIGAIAMDGSSNMALGYNISSATVFPGLRYAGRLADDPTGTMPQGEFTVVDGSVSQLSTRYGDYSAMTVDPVDDCTFWFTGMYNPALQWETRIAAFRFADCSGCGPDSLPQWPQRGLLYYVNCASQAP